MKSVAAAASHPPHLDQAEHHVQHVRQQRLHRQGNGQGNQHGQGLRPAPLLPNFSRQAQTQASLHFVLKTILALVYLGLVLGFTRDKGKYKWDVTKEGNTFINKLVFHFTILESNLLAGTTSDAAYGCKIYCQ
jgi:hypothetical protein